MSEEQAQEVKKMLHVSNTPTSFSDAVNIACRVDGCVLLQFISDTPTIAFENFRTMMTKESAIQLVDTLAKALEYFPKPSAAKKTAPTKQKTSRTKA